ncbi:MAG: CBS domain-containing protein [Treponema sp.]|jgi:tRNA nucleotidyltransferase (CCA-adding enzyme)|nr:CBS domain-containing protein [Treponema sp.]
MDVAFGHSNMDFDCLGSLIIVKKLFPGYRLVRSRLIHPIAQGLYQFYEPYFDFLCPKDLEGKKIDHIIIVDTCTAQRVSEYFSYIRNSDPEIVIYDHHQVLNANILGARVENGKFGANTSFLGKMAMERGIRLASEEATIALTGIYGDTGMLIHENVQKEDLEVASWLMGMGASIKLVKSFLETVLEDDQAEVLNQTLQTMDIQSIQGHRILLSYLELNANVQGLASVVEKIMDLKYPDAYFAFFCVPRGKTTFLIARSRKEKIDLHELLHVYGGGGHQMAASAKITNREGQDFFNEFCLHLKTFLSPATRAGDIMNRTTLAINENATLLNASLFLEKEDLSGVPVVDDEKQLTGFIALENIMKGRRAGAMRAPVKAYMSKPAISADASVTLREVERLFYKHHIGRLPIVQDRKLQGMLTRWDYIQYQKKQAGLES